MEIVLLKDIERLRNNKMDVRIVARIEATHLTLQKRLTITLTDRTNTVRLAVDQDPGWPTDR